MPLDPPYVAKELTDRLVAGLITLQLYDEPARFPFMFGQKIDTTNVTWVLISGFLVSGLLVEDPFLAKF